MKIRLTYDLRGDWPVGEHDPKDKNAEFDKPETIDSIQGALESGGHQVKRIGNARNLLEQIRDLDVDIIFNICEGYDGRCRESQVPILLDMHRIPYVGSDGLTLGVTLDKGLAKKIFIAEGLPTPKFFLATNSDNLDKQNTIGFPVIVKTTYEGTSKGLTENSLVRDNAGLKRQIDFITKTYDQPALVEQFIRGTEFTIAVMGNEKCEAMPVVQISMFGSVELGDNFYTFEMVCSDNLRYACPAKISPEMTKTLQDLAVRAYKAVGCRDFGRVDFRVDEEGNPYILEINPLPCLDKKDIFDLFPRVQGTTYEATVNKILDFALARCGLSGRKGAEKGKPSSGQVSLSSKS